MIPASLNTMMMMMSGSEPLLLDDYPATAAWSSARKLKSTSTRPFVFGAANVTSSSTLPAITRDAIYTSSGEVDISDITTKIGSYNAAGITSWDDQTGNGYVANRPAGTGLARHPLFYSTVSGGFVYLNGKLAPYYLASDLRFLSFPSITLGGEYAIFVVSRSVVNSSNGMIIGGNVSSQTNIYVGKVPSYLSNADTVNTASATNTNTTPTVLCFDKLSGAKRIFENGTQLSTSPTTFARVNNTLGAIGRVGISPSGFVYSSDAQIVEVIIYNRALTADERTYVTNNMKSFYGIT